MELSDILTSLPNRKSTDRYGIGTADQYFREIETCFDGGFCPTKLFGQATQTEWTDALQKASTQLVYCDRDMIIADTRAAGPAGITPGSCLDFDCTVTSTRKDRDGDILETAGAVLDPSAPLLWQHMPFEPLGKVVAETGRSAKNMQARIAVINNEAGRDAAQLIEFGALRISHGFRPMKFEPLDSKEDDLESGWRIQKYEIMEVSLVSIPSNTDAVITAFSRGKLASPMIKGWAQKKYDDRPVRGVGFEVKGESCTCKSADLTSKSEAVDIAYAFESHVKSDTSDGHEHKLFLDSDGNGETDWVNDHSHTVTDFDMEPAVRKFKNNHTHRIDKDSLSTEEKNSDEFTWNKSAGKHFDVALQHLEPSNVEYDWVSRYCGCEIKKLFNLTQSVPTIKMGSFLSGLKESLRDYGIEDTRNITGNGREIPPAYELIQLNSKLSDNFLISGIEFRKGPCNVVVKCEPRWYGMDVTTYADRKDEDEAVKIMLDAWKWASENNFLKNEAFSLSGEFLPDTSEKWEDLFLKKENESALKKVTHSINTKADSCPNRGMIMMGPPGTGKTLAGRITKNLTDSTFIWISSRDFYCMGAFGGLSYGFDLARELAPSILFIEDVDNWLDTRTMDLLKTEMDGIARSTGVVTMLTTNYPERLPEALLDRPGRFHDVLKFDLPSETVRKQMLLNWVDGISGDKLSKAVQKTEGYSGAHIYELANFAKSLSEDDGLDTGSAVMKAIEKIEDQRELINETQLSGSNYRPTRSMMSMIKSTKMKQVSSIVTEKRGRTLSAKNEDSLKKSIDDMDDAKGIEGVPRAAKTLITAAASKVSGVLKQMAPADESATEPEVKQFDIKTLETNEAKRLRDQLDGLIEERECQGVLALLLN